MPRALSIPFSPLTDEERHELLALGWGITGASWSAFASERDDTLLVSADSGKYILKVAHPLDDPARLIRQLELMQHTFTKTLSFATQEVIPTKGGQLTAVMQGRQACLLEYLPGTPIRHNPLKHVGVRAIGAALWELQDGLSDFDDPYDTGHPWALGSLDQALD